MIMKKLLFIAASVALLTACGGAEKAQDEASDSTGVTEAVETPVAQDTVATPAPEAKEEKADAAVNAETAKYDKMLDNYESQINKCFSMSKKGLSINDQALADVWMKAGDTGRKLDKAKKKMTPEQQARLKKLDKRYRDFCLTQPA